MVAAVPFRQALALAALAGRGLLVGNLSVRVLQGILPLFGLLAMQWLLDAVADGVGAADSSAAFAAVVRAVGFAAAVALLGAILGAVGSQIGERHARRCADRCQSLLQRHAAGLDLLQIEAAETSDLLQRAGGEAMQRPARIVADLGALCLAAVTLVLMVLATATAALWLPLLTGLAAVPQVLARLAASRRLFAWQQENTGRQRHLGYLSGLLVGRAYAKDLRVQDLGPRIAAEVDRERNRLTDEQLSLQRRRVAAETAAQGLATAALFATYLYLGNAALLGQLSIGALLLQVQAVQRTQNGVRDCLLSYGALRDDRLFLRHLFAFLQLAPRIGAPASAEVVRTALPGPAAITCEGVQFAYPQRDRAVLVSFDLQLRAGERVALVGPNGAGKSTVVRLLARLMDPDQGRVTFAGVDLRQLDPQALRRRQSVFFQDAVGFELSARDNLEFGAAPDRDAELLAAADLVGIGDTLRALPQGLATRLGRAFAGSVELSAGQWRRLLLARALLRPADLLVLDEPFAFLDAAARDRLAHSLRHAPRTRTLLLVDHRPDTLDWVDRIVVLDGGRIGRDGPPVAASR